MEWICFPAYFVLLTYILLIAFFTAGWFKKKKYTFIPIAQNQLISVVVAFRNEEKHISSLLESLKAQTFKHTEFIFIDDHSKDNSSQIIRNSGITNFMILNSPENKNGKKEALAMGINSSKGELVITTDADCSFNEKWIETIVSFHQHDKAEFIMAPVTHSSKSFFQNLVSVDFLSLQASGAGAAEIQLPFMCNGANLAFTKSLWNKLEGNNNSSYASGDDVFLLHSAIKKINASKIRYLFSQDAIVYTPAPENISSFFHQRIRWAGKSKGYKNKMAIWTSVSVCLLVTSMMTLLFGSFFSITLFYCLISILFVKTLTELPMIISSAKFYKEEKLLLFFFILQPLYFIYTFVIAFFSLFYKSTWKDRTILH